MARRRQKKALYEVIHKTWPNAGQGKAPEQVRPEKPDKSQSPPGRRTTAPPKTAASWPMRPKMFQLNAGRIEISIPYQLAVALVLGLVLLLLVAYQLGQRSERRAAAVGGVVPMPPREGNLAGMPRRMGEPAAARGKNRIVIQTYHRREDLEPVREHFLRWGIETRIVQVGNRSCLVTEQMYENPDRDGTDGWVAKQQIVEVGAKYKAPAGYEPFGAQSFKEPYGMLFDD
jgi:hypothetical protein